MMQERVSIVMATYDRAPTLGRAIDSVVGQDYPHWELIVVDDGSTDDTDAVLRTYADPRIVVVRHDRNRGVTAAKNSGLDRMSGEWFTFVDSDDEILPNGLSAMLAVAEAHPDVDAVTCNCLDSRTGERTGFGLDHEGYIGVRDVARARGEHWGITRARLLGALRFDERIPGFEGIVWLKISARATRYYLDRALRVYHREGDDRVSSANAPRERLDATYRLVAEDAEYLSLLERFSPEAYVETVSAIVLAAVAGDERATAWQFWRRYRGPVVRRAFLFSCCLLGPRWLDLALAARSRLRRRRAASRPARPA